MFINSFVHCERRSFGSCGWSFRNSANLLFLGAELTVFVVAKVSAPTQVQHFVSIRLNPETGRLEGVPDVIKEALAKAGLTEEQVLADPSLAKDILYDIPLDTILLAGKPDPNISLPHSSRHHVAIRYNQNTGKFEGIPPPVREAMEAAGLTDEQVFANPDCAKDVLYKLNLEEVLASLNAEDSYISPPTNAKHNLSISFNAETGKFEVRRFLYSANKFQGIPDAVREAIAKAGLTEEQVLKDPSLAKDVLYQLSLEKVLKEATSVN